MKPAFSVIFLTTLIGAGQGLFLALYAADTFNPTLDAADFQVIGSLIALGLCGLGLVASFFHLGHPERAWRSAAMWRTSWLSREVIALPLFMLGLSVYGLAQYLGWRLTPFVGAAVVLLCLALFVCTAMVYMSIRFLQEWASPLTLANFLLLGCASGVTLATLLATWFESAWPLVQPLAWAAAALTLAGLVTRVASLRRNARLKPMSSLQTAIGIKHPRIVQKAQGFMGGSFNTREFFHGRSIEWLRGVKWAFLVLVFPLPLLCLGAGVATGSITLLALAFVLQYLGLLAERWFFLAQARHPQNLYYQTIS
jgi:sulfite dehydrogenase (quinone) subunit SoeC